MKLKLNLAALQHAVMQIKRKDGTTVECVVIPIKDNHIFKSDKGNLYLDAVAREIPEAKRKGDATHLISQSVGKEAYEALKTAGKYPPTLGDISQWGGGAAAAPETTVSDLETGEDLPF